MFLTFDRRVNNVGHLFRQAEFLSFQITAFNHVIFFNIQKNKNTIEHKRTKSILNPNKFLGFNS